MISLTVQDGVARFRAPSRWLPEGCVEVPEAELTARFAERHGYPLYPARPIEMEADPLVSCVILVMANDPFVHLHLVPSLLANAGGHPLEIVLVYAGPAPGGGLASAPAAVARGYNRGVAAARGEFVAIFHDDVLMADPAWVPRCLDALAAGAVAVTPELQRTPLGPIAKNVPLVMRRRDFPGYDETYLAGWEDLDFTQGLLRRGLRVEEVPLRSLHLSGMSTIIALGPDPRLYREVFARHLLPRHALRELQQATLAAVQADPAVQRLNHQYVAHYLQKHGGDERLLAWHRREGGDGSDRAELEAAYLARIPWGVLAEGRV